MDLNACPVEDYISKVPEDKRSAIIRLREIIRENIPKGFTETLNYGMIGYVVPLSIYPGGYHVDPKLPSTLLRKRTLLRFITMEYMLIPTCCSGLKRNMQNYPSTNWIWEKAASGLKTRKKSPSN